MAGQDMREYVKEQTDLAVVYAVDGAYFSAARVLKALAEKVEAHAKRIKAEEDAAF